MDDHTVARVAGDDPRHVINQFDLPMALVDMTDLTIRAVSNEALALLGRPASQVVGMSLFDLTSAEDGANAAIALNALRRGVVDSYRARWSGPSLVEPSKGLHTNWVRVVEVDGERLALIEAAVDESGPASPLARYLGREPREMVIGTITPNLVVKSISRETESVLGVPSAEVIGQPLVDGSEQHDLLQLITAARHGGGDHSLAMRIHRRDTTGALRTLCLVLTSLAGMTRWLFIITPDEEPSTPAYARDRTASLEHHLRRIAIEVAASGVLQRMVDAPDLSRFPQMQSLSVRQWEVLSRLLHGERVPAIARELFVSQSTVRNHLSAIFERFGVHSQSELLALLRA